MSSFRLLLMPRAQRDLEQIHKHIAADSPQNADRMVERILDALEPLREFPHRSVAMGTSPRIKYPVRTLPVPPYLVFFRVLDDKEVVRVLTVRHGARRRPRRFD